MVGGIVVVYLAGALTRAVIGPVAKAAVKGTIKLGLDVKQVTNEARSEFENPDPVESA